MKFLCVFCVVLYFQSGACLYPVNNGTSVLFQHQNNKQFNDQRSENIPPNLAYSFHNYPSGINYQRQIPIQQQQAPVATIKEPYLRQREDIRLGVQEFSRPFINTKYINNETPKRENNILGRKQGDAPSEYLPSQSFRKLDKLALKPGSDIKEPLRTVSYESPRIPSLGKDNDPIFKPDEGLRLELQSISPEYLKSLIGAQRPFTQNHQDPSLITHSNVGVGDLKHTSLQTDYKKYPTASFQNPSAEYVYKLKQALPYRVNTQQLVNTPQGNTYPNNILINSKRIQDMYTSGLPKKHYTIIHPDGRIEQIDHVESIVAKHPNYVFVKAEDIMKHIQDRPNVFSIPQPPPEQRNPTVESTITSNQQSNVVNQESNRENDAFSVIKKTMEIKVVNTSKLFKQDVLPAPNETNFNKIIINKTNGSVETKPALPLRETYDPKIISKSISVLPIKPIERNVTFANNATPENVQLHLLQNNNESSATRIEHENIIVSNILLNSLDTTVEPINNSNNATEISINTTSTPISNGSTNTNNVTEILIDTTLATFSNETITLTNCNDTYNSKIPKENNDIVTSVSSTSLAHNENTTENSPFWFQADEKFWDKIINGNNARNLIYFLFVPPKPNSEKESKTTVYPNGTTVEEVIETINGDDGRTLCKVRPDCYHHSIRYCYCVSVRRVGQPVKLLALEAFNLSPQDDSVLATPLMLHVSVGNGDRFASGGPSAQYKYYENRTALEPIFL